MQTIPLQSIPNQEFTIQLNNNLFDITIRETNGCMSVSITINSVLTIENMRIVAGMRLIPSQYEEAGNFIFASNNEDLPFYTEFGNSQQLVYVTAAELAIIRAPVAPPITASYFNPLAALPLRFSPQGYT